MSCSIDDDNICVGCGLKGGGDCLGDDGFTDNDRDRFEYDTDLTKDLALILKDLVIRIKNSEHFRDLDGFEYAKAETALRFLVVKGKLDSAH